MSRRSTSGRNAAAGGNSSDSQRFTAVLRIHSFGARDRRLDKSIIRIARLGTMSLFVQRVRRLLCLRFREESSLRVHRRTPPLPAFFPQVRSTFAPIRWACLLDV